MKMNYAIMDEKLIHISEVESGLKCNCICLCCNAKLIARKGKIKEHHFAHANGEDCKKGFETMLHIMAKLILKEEKRIRIPNVYILSKLSTFSYQGHIFHRETEEFLPGSTFITFNDVELEKKIDEFIPDVILYNNNHRLLVEIKVSHGVDETKLRKIRKSNISTLEIDLSNIKANITIEGLRDLLINDVYNKEWIYNKKAEYYKDTWLSLCDRFEPIIRINTREKYDYYRRVYQIDGCPQNRILHNGKPYANIKTDCYNCQYCIHIEWKPFRYYDPEDVVSIYCCGKNKISSAEELKLFLQNRKK